MKAVVLGATAVGGFPPWNSNAEACRRARAGDANAASRTQATHMPLSPARHAPSAGQAKASFHGRTGLIAPNFLLGVVAV